VLAGLGLKVIRIKNEELADMDGVLARILEFAEGQA